MNKDIIDFETLLKEIQEKNKIIAELKAVLKLMHDEYDNGTMYENPISSSTAEKAEKLLKKLGDEQTF